MNKKGLTWTQHFFFGSWLLLLLYLLIGYSLPYSFYADVRSLEAFDVCVGDDKVRYYSERHPKWGMLGQSYAEIVKFENSIKLETTINRGSIDNQRAWAYEAGTTEATFDTNWSEPFTEPGVYGANSWNTIFPLPFISKTVFTSAEDAKFNVIVCDF